MSEIIGPRSGKDGPKVIEIKFDGHHRRLHPTTLQTGWLDIAAEVGKRLGVNYQAREIENDLGLRVAFLNADESHRFLSTVEVELDQWAEQKAKSFDARKVMTESYRDELIRRYGLNKEASQDDEFYRDLS